MLLGAAQIVPPTSESNRVCSGDASSPVNLAASESYEKPVLSTLWETVEETSDEIFKSEDVSPHHDPFSDPAEVIMLTDEPPKQESSISHNRCTDREFSPGTEPHGEATIDSEISLDSFSHANHIKHQLDKLSLSSGGNSELDSSTWPAARISKNSFHNDGLNASVQSQASEPEISSFTSDSVLNKRVRSLDSQPPNLDGSSIHTDSGSFFRTSATATTVVSEATIKTALELESQGWFIKKIFEFLAGQESSVQCKFCEDLWQLDSLFEENYDSSAAMMAYLIRAGKQKLVDADREQEV